MKQTVVVSSTFIFERDDRQAHDQAVPSRASLIAVVDEVDSSMIKAMVITKLMILRFNDRTKTMHFLDDGIS
jgi:hypothetical protein